MGRPWARRYAVSIVKPSNHSSSNGNVMRDNDTTRKTPINSAELNVSPPSATRSRTSSVGVARIVCWRAGRTRSRFEARRVSGPPLPYGCVEVKRVDEPPRVARVATNGVHCAAVDIRFTPAEDRFRVEARAWLEANMPREPKPEGDLRARAAYDLAWQQRMYQG